jgi:uncharacterized protein (DUF983 family)
MPAFLLCEANPKTSSTMEDVFQTCPHCETLNFRGSKHCNTCKFLLPSSRIFNKHHYWNVVIVSTLIISLGMIVLIAVLLNNSANPPLDHHPPITTTAIRS